MGTAGRTTLLAVAAAVEPVTTGTVRFDGTDVAERSPLGSRGGISYCTTEFPPAVGVSVVEQVAMPALGQDEGVPTARRRAVDALGRVGGSALIAEPVAELSHADATRVALARALVSEPRLLVIDQPNAGVSLATERDQILELLRVLADDGMAVLMAVDEGAELAGADRALTIDAGELHGEIASPVSGDVIPLRRADRS